MGKHEEMCGDIGRTGGDIGRAGGDIEVRKRNSREAFLALRNVWKSVAIEIARFHIS